MKKRKLDSKRLTQNLKTLRSITGLTQHELCEEIGMKQTTYASFESTREFYPTHKHLLQILDYFQVTYEELFFSNVITKDMEARLKAQEKRDAMAKKLKEQEYIIKLQKQIIDSK